MSKFTKRLETLIKIGVFAGTVMYGINKIIESTALTRNLLNCEDGKYFKWSHGSVYYKKLGKGSPVLLIHDLEPGSSAYEWHEIVNDLSKNHTVYSVDLPGCGRSSKINQETYVNYFYVKFLKDFVDEVIGEKTDIIATGYSCSFATMAANIHPDLFEKLTFINPLHPNQLSKQINWKSKLVKVLLDCPILGSFLYYIDYSYEQIEFRFTEKSFFNPFAVTPKLIHTYYEASHMAKANGRFLLSSIHGNYMTVNIENAFRTLQNPIILIFGKQYNEADAIAEKYCTLNPKCKTIFISKTKMLPQLEAPLKLLKYLLI